MRVLYGEEGDYVVIEIKEAAVYEDKNLILWDYEEDQLIVILNNSELVDSSLCNLLENGFVDLRDYPIVQEEESDNGASMKCF